MMKDFDGRTIDGRAIVFYHGTCNDGFGAAWAAWTALHDLATYIPVTYGHSLREYVPNIPSGTKVFVLDFSFDRPTMEWLAGHTELVVLDHHKTAEEDLAGIPGCTFDMSHSGAWLAWQHFHPHIAPPRLIRYLEDRDLWKFALPSSRAVTALINCYPYGFDTWTGLSRALGEHSPASEFSLLVAHGEFILASQKRQIDDICANVQWREVVGHIVPVVNTTVLFSEVGAELCRLYPEAPFSMYYFDRGDGQRQHGLRSRGGFDVSAVARTFGGGGHPSAAGFEMRVGTYFRQVPSPVTSCERAA